GNIADIEKLVGDGLVDLLAGILTLIGVIIVMLCLSPTYTLVSIYQLYANQLSFLAKSLPKRSIIAEFLLKLCNVGQLGKGVQKNAYNCQVSMAIVPALFLMTFTYTRGIKAATKQASKATGQVSDVATENINALTVIKVFTREEKEAILSKVIG